eukprot:TRINITY_DN6127_c0_g2_i1.p1 TRINITY_DN6127_c0_g2~~TRINITY_DN6127_c0_g2_i1.p1  ORF type:complete len:141 (-),score=14.66 TRINITY_DN6127_c0_g2_i1:205-627(-)
MRYQHYVVSTNQIVYLGLAFGPSISNISGFYNDFRCLSPYDLDYIRPTRISDFVGITTDAFIMYQATLLDNGRYVEGRAYYAEPDLFPDPDLSKPEVATFMDYRDGQGMVSRNQEMFMQNYPSREKNLMQHAHQIIGDTE